jgi:hypothetical protein
MRSLVATILVLGLLAASLPPAQAQVVAQARGGQGGTINHAPRPGVYAVVLIDAGGRKVRLRSATDGKTADVQVGEDVYDLSKLKIGDKIRVEFLAADTPNQKPVAASIWPEK